MVESFASVSMMQDSDLEGEEQEEKIELLLDH